MLANKPLDEIHDFVGALAVEVARRFVAQQESGVGNDGARNADALLLSSGKLARDSDACGRSSPPLRAQSPRGLRRSDFESFVSSSGSSTF